MKTQYFRGFAMLLLIVTSTCTNGCLTEMTHEHFTSSKSIATDNGGTAVESKTEQSFYVVLPFAVAGDVALSPAYAVVLLYLYASIPITGHLPY